MYHTESSAPGSVNPGTVEFLGASRGEYGADAPRAGESVVVLATELCCARSRSFTSSARDACPSRPQGTPHTPGLSYDPEPLALPAAGNLLICCSRPWEDLIIDN